MGFTIGSALRSPFTLTAAIASTVAPVTAGVLKAVAGSFFEAGKMAAGAAGMMSMAMGNPMGAMAFQAIAGGLNMAEGASMGMINGAQMGAMGMARMIPFSNYGTAMLPNMYQRAAMGVGTNNGFAGSMAQSIYVQIGMSNNIMQNGMMPQPLSYSTAYNSSAATSAAATINNGFMPTGSSALDLANSVANSPTYSPAEQSLLNQITDPAQKAMQELQMQMQKQALLATTISNLANMRHEMLKTVANNLRA